MSNGAILAVALVALGLLATIVVVVTARRRDVDAAVGEMSRETRRRDRKAAKREIYEGRQSSTELQKAVSDLQKTGTALSPTDDRELVPFTPPDPEVYGVTRRQFLTRANVAFMGLGISGFGAACIGFLWGPPQSGGFGSQIVAGKVPDLLAEIDAGNGFLYRPDGRMWLTAYPSAALDAARAVYSEAELAGMEAGIVALYQKCPHLGCRVPSCDSSQWFECPCHGSQYNQAGEKKGGPAPRGMDRFGMSVDAAGNLTVDTGLVIPGPPIGTNTTGQEAEGPHCIGQTTHE